MNTSCPSFPSSPDQDTLYFISTFFGDASPCTTIPAWASSIPEPALCLEIPPQSELISSTSRRTLDHLPALTHTPTSSTAEPFLPQTPSPHHFRHVDDHLSLATLEWPANAMPWLPSYGQAGPYHYNTPVSSPPLPETLPQPSACTIHSPKPVFAYPTFRFDIDRMSSPDRVHAVTSHLPRAQVKRRHGTIDEISEGAPAPSKKRKTCGETVVPLRTEAAAVERRMGTRVRQRRWLGNL